MNRRGLKAAAKACIRDAQGGVKSITLTFVLSAVVLILAQWGLTELVDRLPAGGRYLSQSLSAQTRSYALVVLISLVCQLGMVLLEIGYASFSLKLSRGNPVAMGDLLEGFRHWGKGVMLYLYISLLLGLWSSLLSLPVSYVVTALYLSDAIGETGILAIMGGYAALITGILSYRYRMAWFVLLDGPEKPIRRIVAETKAINQTHRVELFCLDVSFLPWAALCVLSCGVLLIWKLPYITATYAHAYNFMLEDYAQRQRRLEELLERQRQQFRPM